MHWHQQRLALNGHCNRSTVHSCQSLLMPALLTASCEQTLCSCTEQFVFLVDNPIWRNKSQTNVFINFTRRMICPILFHDNSDLCVNNMLLEPYFKELTKEKGRNAPSISTGNSRWVLEAITNKRMRTGKVDTDNLQKLNRIMCYLIIGLIIPLHCTPNHKRFAKNCLIDNAV
jgi:hypothetical protein